MSSQKPNTPSVGEYLKLRQASVRRAMAEHKLDGLLLTHPSDLAYVTHFTGDDSIGLITTTDFFLVTDFRYQEQAKIEAPWLKVTLRVGKMSEALAKSLARSKAERVGFEANFTSYGTVNMLKKALKELAAKRPAAGKIKLLPVEDLLVNIRKIKDDLEIGIIREAVKVAEGAYVALRKQIKVGQTENYLAGLLAFEMRCRGASDTSFPSIIATGPASSLPHYRPAEIPIAPDQPLLIDWGGKYMGYCSDLTRTLLIGNVSPKISDAYKVCLAAQEAAIDALRPGITTKQADKVARSLIDKAGYKGKFGHGLGHGIGRDIHELPALRKVGVEDVLQPGMIVTVEPGIYLPGIGGIRIEDDVLITEAGHEVLSSLNKSYEDCHLE